MDALPPKSTSAIEALKQTDQSLDESADLAEKLCKMANEHLKRKISESLKNAPPFKRKGDGASPTKGNKSAA